MINSGVINELATLLFTDDTDLLSSVVWALSNISSHGVFFINRLKAVNQKETPPENTNFSPFLFLPFSFSFLLFIFLFLSSFFLFWSQRKVENFFSKSKITVFQFLFSVFFFTFFFVEAGKAAIVKSGALTRWSCVAKTTRYDIIQKACTLVLNVALYGTAFFFIFSFCFPFFSFLLFVFSLFFMLVAKIACTLVLNVALYGHILFIFFFPFSVFLLFVFFSSMGLCCKTTRYYTKSLYF